MTDQQKNMARAFVLLAAVAGLFAWLGWLGGVGKLGDAAVAAWVQAVGTIGAVWSAVSIGNRQAREARERERSRQLAKRQAAMGLANAAILRVRIIAEAAADPHRSQLLLPPTQLIADLNQLQTMLLSFPIGDLGSPTFIQNYADLPTQLLFVRGHLEEAGKYLKVEDIPQDVAGRIINSLRQCHEYAVADASRMQASISE